MEEKDQVVTEVKQTDEQVGNTTIHRESVSQTSSTPGSVLASRIVSYLGGLIIGLLALRFILQLFGANQSNGFVDFIYNVSYFFVSPFFGIFSSEPTYGDSQVETNTLVAIVVYALIVWAISRLLTLGRTNPEI